MSMQEGGSQRNERATGEEREREREKRTNFRLMKMKAAPVELRAPIKSKNEGGRRRTDVHGIWLHEASCYSFASQNSDSAATNQRTDNMCEVSTAFILGAFCV